MFVELKARPLTKIYGGHPLIFLNCLANKPSRLKGVLEYLNKDPAGASSKASSHNSTILQKRTASCKNSLCSSKPVAGAGFSHTRSIRITTTSALTQRTLNVESSLQKSLGAIPLNDTKVPEKIENALALALPDTNTRDPLRLCCVSLNYKRAPSCNKGKLGPPAGPGTPVGWSAGRLGLAPRSRRSRTRPAERGAGRRRHGQPGESTKRVNRAQPARPF